MKNAQFASVAYQKLSNSFLSINLPYISDIKNVLRDLKDVYLSPELPNS